MQALQFKLGDYIRTEQAFPAGQLRAPAKLRGMQLNHDLVVKGNIDVRERVEFILNKLGLELVEIEEEHDVLIARHDGRELEPWQEVKAPVPNPGHQPLRPGMAAGMAGSVMNRLFYDFMFYQNDDLTASRPIIIDETGLESEPVDDPKNYVSSESPYWGGESAPGIAMKWFEEQFGVTFERDRRPVTIYSVRERE